MRRTRVYVSGPIRIGDREQNLRNLAQAGHELVLAGFAPFVPVVGKIVQDLTGEYQEDGPWIAVDTAWVAVSDAVVRLPGESVGADQEVGVADELQIPVYPSVKAIVEDPPFLSDRRFHALLHYVAKLQDRKQSDYGRVGDPFANVRASSEWGLRPWVGAMLRANDKMKRLQKYAREGKLVNETVDDSFDDLAVYALLAKVILLEEQGRPVPGADLV